MYLNILSDRQNELLSFISSFRRNYYLVGGTAIALHIGHRRSIDYDLFTDKTINKSLIRKKVFELKFSKQTLFEDTDQMHFLINVDLYFIIKDSYSINDISAEAKQIFGDLFSEKLFREQMAFHEDIDYSEPVEYLPGFEVSEKEIKEFLINKSLENI